MAKSRTLIIEKEGYFYLRNKMRQKMGYSILSYETLNRLWGKFRFRNGGANSKTHPISDNEIRIDNSTFLLSIEGVKEALEKEGLKYREDGYEEQYIFS